MTLQIPRRYRLLPALIVLQYAWPHPGQAQQVLRNVEQGQTQGPIADFGSGSLSPAMPPGGNYQPPKVLSRTQVEYPLLADLNRIEGAVTIRFYIDETGHVTKVAVIKSDVDPLLYQLGRDPRLLQWTFQPAMLDGKPVPSMHDQIFEFRLDPEEQRRLALKRLALTMGTPDPPYPAAAAANHLEGAVTIGVHWTKQGLVGQIGLIKSSGVPMLDAAALRFAYENWHIDPAATSMDAQFVKTVRFPPSP